MAGTDRTASASGTTGNPGLAKKRATRRQVRRAKSRTSTRMTSRGVGLLVSGVVVAVLGVGLATPVLVYIGLAMTCAVAVACAWMLATVKALVRTHTGVHREVIPHPLTAGVPGRVSVTIHTDGKARSILPRSAATANLDLREQAAAELTGGMSAMASVDQGKGTLTLRYGLHPTARGRWSLGPALIHSSDPFGLLMTDTRVGDQHLVPVWPAIVDLAGTAGALMGHADRAVVGAHTPAPDDASLRDYRDGDDMRRVHWPSSARHGAMLVRSDERAGRRPATVILDAPHESVALERAISAAASVAVSVLGSGHPVRLVGAGLDPAATRHVGERGGDAARYDLLNQTVDLHSPESPEAGTADLVRAARLVADHARDAEVIVAILEPLADRALAALAPLGDSGRAWAIVRTDDHVEALARDTVTGLRKAGWRATTAHADEDLVDLWARMLGAGDVT